MIFWDLAKLITYTKKHVSLRKEIFFKIIYYTSFFGIEQFFRLREREIQEREIQYKKRYTIQEREIQYKT
jgi:hypothetical protein